jgi:hypothetical protein
MQSMNSVRIQWIIRVALNTTVCDAINCAVQLVVIYFWRFAMKSRLSSVVLASILFLSACGGEDGSSDPASVANKAEAVKPATTCSVSITQSPYNADPTGTTDSTTAIQNALNYAATNGCGVTIPAGTFLYSNVLDVGQISVTGVGVTSILKATNFTDEAVHLTGTTGASLNNFAISSAATTRLSTLQSAAVWIDGATSFDVQGLTINGSASVGIFNSGGQGGEIQNNTVNNTLADGITNTNGAYGTFIGGNLVTGTGDDGISIVSYNNAPIVSGIIVQNNTITGQVWGRGMSDVGGNNNTYTGNIVNNTDGYADMYIAAESEYSTFGIATVTVIGNTFLGGGTDQGDVTIYNSQGTTYNITGVAISGNQIVNPPFVAYQFVGNGIEKGTIKTTSLYTGGGSGVLENNGNPKSSITVKSTSYYPVADYTTPIAPGGSGAPY